MSAKFGNEIGYYNPLCANTYLFFTLLSQYDAIAFPRVKHTRRWSILQTLKSSTELYSETKLSFTSSDLNRIVVIE